MKPGDLVWVKVGKPLGVTKTPQSSPRGGSDLHDFLIPINVCLVLAIAGMGDKEEVLVLSGETLGWTYSDRLTVLT
jgi:hypothetical protein